MVEPSTTKFFDLGFKVKVQGLGRKTQGSGFCVLDLGLCLRSMNDVTLYGGPYMDILYLQFLNLNA